MLIGTDEYYERRMLKSHLSPSINQLGSLQWELVGCSMTRFSSHLSYLYSKV